MAKRSPLLRSVTLTLANTNYNLYTLLAAVETSVAKRAEMIQVQLDVNANSARLYVGDPDSLSATDCGVELVASQAMTVQSVGSNLILLSDIELRTDTGNTRVNVTAITR